MTDLDRQIAEIKGWVPLGLAAADTDTEYQVALKRLSDGKVEIQPAWSTSDSKALELVDELGQRLTLEGEKDHWTAMLWCRETPEDTFPNCIQEEGKTRPEAICRAYIAAKQFLNQKGR